MDEFFARLDDLEEGDSDIFLIAAHLKDVWGDVLTLHFLLRGRTWSGGEVDERWQLVAQEVAEHRVTFGEVAPTLEPEYSRLRERQVQWSKLMFSAAPASAPALLSDLRAVHPEEEWGPFGRFGLGGRLSFGSGVFAEGPKPLMDVYESVLNRHGMRPNVLWRGPHADHHRSPPPVLCLHLNGTVWVDDTYVLAQTFHAMRLP